MYGISPEQQRRAELLRQAPLNAWVALSQDESRIVASGPNLRSVITECHAAGETDPVLTRTPERWLPLCL